MGTMLSGPRLPWDVPVRLVPRTRPGTRPRQQRQPAPQPPVRTLTRPVDIGLELPGVVGVSVTTATIEGRTLLSAITPSDGALTERPVALRALLAELEVDGAVPVLVEGTPFTVAVLTALAGVAAGTRCSYAELASRAGRPRAVRAAAHVMATNLVPLVLPCHRVVPSGGGTGRHGWGDAVKPVLLDAEQRVGGSSAWVAGPAPRALPSGERTSLQGRALASLEGSHSPAECARLESG